MGTDLADAPALAAPATPATWGEARARGLRLTYRCESCGHLGQGDALPLLLDLYGAEGPTAGAELRGWACYRCRRKTVAPVWRRRAP